MRWQDAIRLDHVACGVRDAMAVTPFLVGELGGRPHGAGPGPDYRFWQWRFAREARLEILVPDGPPGGFLHRFLDAHGPGVHHVTFKVPDLRKASDRAQANGYEVVGYNDDFPGWKEAFLHPKQAQGVVVQLAESDPEEHPEDIGEWPFPAGPAARAEPADIVALRLTATSAEGARRQWETTLGGRAEETNTGLDFCWEGSPLRINVDIESGAAEGPRAIEVTPRSGLALPEGPHPNLGIAFVPTR